MRALKTFFLWGFIIAVLGSSCTAYYAARQNKRNNKLYSQVIGNEIVANRVTTTMNAVNPISVKPIYIQGKDIITIDTLESPLIMVDSILTNNCPTLNIDSLKKLLTRIIHIKTLKVDTTYLVDSSCQRNLKSQTNDLNVLKGINQQQTTEITAIKSSKRSITIWFISYILVSIIVIVGLLYLLFTKKL